MISGRLRPARLSQEAGVDWVLCSLLGTVLRTSYSPVLGSQRSTRAPRRGRRCGSAEGSYSGPATYAAAAPALVESIPIPAISSPDHQQEPRNANPRPTFRAPREQRHDGKGAPRGAATGYQGPPNARSVLASRASQSSARSSPRTSAIARTVSGTRYDALVRPRCGTGVRYGASVSTRIRS